MVTMRGTEIDLDHMLGNMIELDLDAIDAYKGAITALKDPAIKIQMGGFMADHERHVRDLSAVVVERGRTPPTKGDFKRVLTQGRVLIGRLRGDRGILLAMRSNEEDTTQAYEQASERGDLSDLPELAALLRAGLADERRHRDWIQHRLRTLEDKDR